MIWSKSLQLILFYQQKLIVDFILHICNQSIYFFKIVDVFTLPTMNTLMF
jgi:hypothetical protein